MNDHPQHGANRASSSPARPAARRALTLATLALALGAATLSPGSAQAALQHPLLSRLGVSYPGSVAFDPKRGDLLVVNGALTKTHYIELFDSAGALVETWTGANTPAGSFGSEHGFDEVRIAVNDTSGDVYVSQYVQKYSTGEIENPLVDVFSPAGAYLCQITGAGEASTSPSECDKSAPGAPGGSLRQPASLAVDQANGDLYVVEGVSHLSEEAVIDEFSPSGKFLAQLNGSSTPAGSFGTLLSLAFDQASGHLLVAEQGESESQKVTISATAGQYRLKLGGAETGDLAYDATPAEVKAALETLPAIGAGSVDVSPQSQSFVVTFTKQLWGTDVEQLQVGAGTTPLSGGSGGSVTTLQQGRPNAILSFDRSGGFVESWVGANTPAGSFGKQGGVPQLTAAGGDVYVSDEENLVVDRLSSAGAYLSQIAGVPGGASLRRPRALALDEADGRIYVVDDYPPSFSPESRVYAFGAVPVLVPDLTIQAASPIQAFAATLRGTVNPDGVAVTSCRFEYVPEAAFKATKFAEAKRQPCAESPAQIGQGSAAVPVEAEIGGLKPETAYRFRLNAANGNETPNEISYGAYSAPEALETLPVPTVDLARPTSVGPESAQLEIEVNPKGHDTSCRVEWGASSAYGNSAACQPEDLGSGSSDAAASLRLEGLSPETTYHWRVIAESIAATVKSPDHTFVYLPHEAELQGSCANEALRTENGSTALPDCRAWEQVTPTQKNGALIDAVFFGLRPQIAATGERVMTPSIQCFAQSVSCVATRQMEGGIYSFQRSPTGWQTTPLSPPATRFPTNTSWLTSPDTGGALFSMPTPPLGEDDFYARSPQGAFADLGPVTETAQGIGTLGTNSLLASADLSHLLYGESESVFAADEGKGSTAYEYAGAANTAPLLVGVSGPQGSSSLISRCGTVVGSTNRNYPINANGALSADGRTAFFTATQCASGTGENEGVRVPVDTLYARIDGEAPDAHTTPISEPAAQAGCASAACKEDTTKLAYFRAGYFEGAAADGSHVYFTSTQRLLDPASQDANSTDSAANCPAASGSGCNLYLYDLGAEAGHNLFDASAGDTSGQGPQVQGVLAISADASHVYFVAKGVLAENQGAATDPETGEAQRAQAGQENLYLYEQDGAHPEGRTAFIATLSGADTARLAENGGEGEVNVSPDGRYLLFSSHAALTADATRLLGPAQIYRYDAQGAKLLRVSIGERGFNDNGNEGSANAEIVADFKTIVSRTVPTRLDPSMSNDGSRVFFQSPTGLTPGALNDKPIDSQGHLAENVYEWEAQGSGACVRPEGCVHLISDGRDTAEHEITSAVELLGTDASGENVFFTTDSALTPSDTDTQRDYYDARAGGGFPRSAKPVICGGDACKGQGSTEGPLPSPATNTFQGPAEGPAHPYASKCRKGFVKRRGGCVKPRRHAKKHKRRGRAAARGRGGGAR